MKQVVVARVAALTIIVAVFTGCASWYLGRGDDAAARGDWDEAFRNYRAALDRDATNRDARSKLAHAREQAAQFHLQAARQGLDQQRFEEAIEELRLSLEYKPDVATQALLDRSIVAKRRAEADDEMAKAARSEALGDLNPARAGYERALALDPERTDSKERLKEVEKQIRRADDLAHRAQTALTSGKLQTAERLATQAQEYHPKDHSAAVIIEVVHSERVARGAEAEARAAESAGELDAAVEMARRAFKTRSTPDRELLKERLERKAGRHYQGLGDRAASLQEWDNAIEYYERAQEFRSDSQLQTKIRDSRYEREVSRALQAQARDDFEGALEHYRRANEIRPNLAAASELKKLEKSVGGPALSGRDFYEKRQHSVVFVQTQKGSGSGVVVDDGIILTNKHVLDGTTGVIQTPSGQRVPYYRAWVHTFADIAIISVTGLVAESAPVGKGLDLRPGDAVKVIGNPLGLTFSFSEGSVAAVGRSLDGVTQLIQFTAPISPGSSGGPVFNESGEVVGLATSTATSGQNINFAVPIEYGVELLHALRR